MDKCPTTVCPRCGAQSAGDKKFCEYDGTLLESIEPFVAPDLEVREEGAARQNNLRRRWILQGITGVILVAALIVYYLVFQGNRGHDMAKVEENLNNALKTRGFNVAVTLDKGGKVSVEGAVESEGDKEAALNIVRSHKDVRGLIDKINVKAAPVEVERDLNKLLDNEGLTRVLVEVNPDYSAKVTGSVANDGEKTKALGIINSSRAIRGVREDLKIKTSKVSRVPSEVSLTEEKGFLLSGLTPSSFASMQYRDSVTFRSPKPGRIILEAVWKQQTTLALILNGPTGDSHAQKDGKSPLKVTYRVTPQDFAKGSIWEATVANFTGVGPVEGVLKVSFLAEGVSKPGQHLAIPGDVAKLEGEINKALRKNGIGSVSAEVANDGSVLLKGTVSKAADKQKAMEIVRQFKPLKSIKDIIFVVAS